MPDTGKEVRMRVRRSVGGVIVLVLLGIGVGFVLGLLRPRGGTGIRAD